MYQPNPIEWIDANVEQPPVGHRVLALSTGGHYSFVIRGVYERAEYTIEDYLFWETAEAKGRTIAFWCIPKATRLGP